VCRGKQRRRFTEFKVEAFRLALAGDKSQRAVTLDLGLKPESMYRWVKQFRGESSHSFPGQGLMKDRGREVDFRADSAAEFGFSPGRATIALKEKGRRSSMTSRSPQQPQGQAPRAEHGDAGALRPRPDAAAHGGPPSARQRIAGLRALVGNTPLLAIDYTYRGRPAHLYAKVESLNMTGSVKDRMALHVLERAYEKGTLAPGALIIEATSGNTGISFSAIGRALGHPVAIFIPDWLSPERIDLIRGFGADVRLVSAAAGGFLGSIRLAEELARGTSGAFLPRQFSNEDNSAAHERTTGPEIWSQLQIRGLVPDAFVAGVGTGGTIMGAGRFLRRMNPAVKLHPVEPSNSPTLSTGCKTGHHRIQGISDEFIPPIVDLTFLDRVLAVDDGDAILMAQKLTRQLGLAVGISSGANFLAAVQEREELGRESLGRPANVVTLFPDSNKKYLSTALMKDEPARDGSAAGDIELEGFRAMSRTCDMCFPDEG